MSRRQPWLRQEALVELVVWFAVLFVLDLLLVSKVSAAEVVLAVAVAAVGAVSAVAARAASPTRVRLPARALRWLPHVPGQVLLDTARVWWAALRRRTGEWQEVPLPAAAGDEPRAAGVRAAAAMVMSLTPGSVCADVRVSDGMARVHVFGGTGSRLTQALSR